MFDNNMPGVKMSVPLGDNELSLQAARSEEGPAQQCEGQSRSHYQSSVQSDTQSLSGLRSHSRKYFTQMDLAFSSFI